MRGRRVIMGRVGAVAITLGLVLVSKPASGDPPDLGPAAKPCAARPCRDPGGPAVITGPDFFIPLNSGTGDTVWSIKLPPGASCSGDTAIDNFHVFTYVVPASVDPGTLKFGSGGPENNPATEFPLVDDGGSPQIALNTGIGTGQVPVPALPRMKWANPPTPFDSSLIPPATYNVGIACADGAGAKDKFWNVQETFSGDPTVATGDNAFAWSVVGGSNETTTTIAGTETTTTIAGTETTTTIPGTTTTTNPDATTTTTLDPTGSTTSTVAGDTTTTTTGDPAAGGGSSSGDGSSSAGGSSSGDGSSSSGGLALTGASVLRVGGLGLLLFLLGLAVDRSAGRRRGSQRRGL